MTSKEYMQCVTAVDPYWLSELGPMFFSLKTTDWGQKEKRKQERADLQVMEEELAEAQRRQRETEATQRQLETPRPRTRIMTPGLRTPATPRNKKPRFM